MPKTKFPNTPLVLAILDGWGIAPKSPGNAIELADTPNIDRFWASFPHTTLEASGEAVGLPRGEAGNTETGHLNIGAGRVVYQDLSRINKAIADGSFFESEVLLGAVNHVNKNDSALHLMGILQVAGVHSNIEHLFALIHFASLNSVKRLYLHLFTDGRDSPPSSSASFISQLREVIKKEGVGEIATIMGRYWSMDRDLKWDRTKKAYNALTEGIGNKVKSPEEAIALSYSEGKTDEFIDPAIITDSRGNPVSLIGKNDAVVFFNFRIDRPRQLTSAFVSKNFDASFLEWDFDPYATKYGETHISHRKKQRGRPFERKTFLDNLYLATMTEYAKSFEKDNVKVIFPKMVIQDTLGEVLSKDGISQLRMSESEKERFVTYYFNGQLENRFEKEERIITPSPAVPTYDQKPEMSAYEQTETIIQKLSEGKYEFILINYANPDMVGHTGNIGPATKACETVDFCVGKIANWLLAYGGTLVITGDHGNAEEMINPKTGQIDTEHNGNPVPFIVIKKNFQGKNVEFPGGILADIAPTILSILGLKKPLGMTGRDLLVGSVLSD